MPFLDLINDEDVEYMMSRKGRYTWFNNLEKRPIKLKSGKDGITGSREYLTIKPLKELSFYRIYRRIRGALKILVKGYG